jgi:hypothetical protein
MGRRKYIESEQDKLDRMQRLTEAIAEIESYLQFFEDKGQQADVGCWVVRYQVRQKDKINWYYKLQADRPIFEQKNAQSFSKYQHLGKAGTIAHVDAVIPDFSQNLRSGFASAAATQNTEALQKVGFTFAFAP